MEASAFLQVYRYASVNALGIIKGVSDMGDELKGVGNGVYYDSALGNAANAAKAFTQ